MMAALQWLAVLWGVTYAVTDSLIFAPVRIAIARKIGPLWSMLFYCPACFGFWASLGLYPFGLSLGQWPHSALGWACAGFSGIAAGRAFGTLFQSEQFENDARFLPWMQAARENLLRPPGDE